MERCSSIPEVIEIESNQRDWVLHGCSKFFARYIKWIMNQKEAGKKQAEDNSRPNFCGKKGASWNITINKAVYPRGLLSNSLEPARVRSRGAPHLYMH